MDPGNFYSLSDQPTFDGSTGYCEPGFGLVNQNMAGARALEADLHSLNKTGPMLGTKMSFGRKRRRKRRYSKKSKKKRSKKYGKKRRRRRSKFGNYKNGKLSTAPGNIGLPMGESGPINIFDTYPDPLLQGAPLPRPYGPRDNLRMQSLYNIRGFGKRRRRRRSKSYGKRKRKFSRKRKRKRRFSRKFGSTPGTKAWKTAAAGRNAFASKASEYANPGSLTMAQGLFAPEVQLTVKGLGNAQHLTPYLNEPLQFSDNALNTPTFAFGRKKRKNKRSFGRKRRRSFGPLKGGPNTVGYQNPIPMYHAGGTTINFATNQLYSPTGLIGNVGSVQPDGMTPNAWLTKSVGIGDGLGNRYRFGKKKAKKHKNKRSKKKFGDVYTPDGWTEGSGHLTIRQPGPKEPKLVKGSFVSYGKKKIKKRKSQGSKLKTSFGGKTITLDSGGKISIT